MQKLAEDPFPEGAESFKTNNKKNGNGKSALKGFTGFVLKFFNAKSQVPIEEQIKELFEEQDPEGIEVSSEERIIVGNVLEFGDLRVSDIMIPRTDIVAIEENINKEELLSIILDKEHTRMPVFSGTLDNVTGFVHIKDLISMFAGKNSLQLKSLIRTILYVPPSMKVSDLLIKMKKERVHIAVVLDEYGGTQGLATFEDIVEEIVGEIKDEHDEAEDLNEQVRKIDSGVYEVSARISIAEVENILGVSLQLDENKNEEYDTLGGLLFFMLSRVPKKGEIIVHPFTNTEFTILDADQRRIKTLLIKSPSNEQ